MFDMLSYAEIAYNIRPNIIALASMVENEGFDPKLEFDTSTMDFILSKDYIVGMLKYRAVCSIDNCLRISKRNNMCKHHNIELNSKEKCKKRGCENLKYIYKGVKDRFCHKHRTENTTPQVKMKVEIHQLKTKKPTCSIDNCKKIARRNGVCKNHNLVMYPSEKCKLKRCNNMKDFTKKNRNDYCYRHKDIKITKDYILTMT